MDLNKLYKILRINDKKLLDRFDDEGLSDDDFFLCGIKSDIVSNALNVLINDFIGNIESPGVDNSCRSILEALVILKMNENGDISDAQKKIYRYSYALVDYGNCQSVLLAIKDIPLMKRFFEDREKAIEAIKEKYKCGQETINKKIRKICDPDFYLQKEIKDYRVKFSDLIKEYPVGEEETVKAYDFFSILIHPRCEMNDKIEDSLSKLKRIYILNVYNLVYQFLESYGLLIPDPQSPNFEEERSGIVDIAKTIYDLDNVDKAFDDMTKKLCVLKNGSDMFMWHHLKRLRHIMKDMQISLSLGYKEHTIQCLKQFFEQQSVFCKINSANSLNDFEVLKQAYWLTSRIQIQTHLDKVCQNGKTHYKKEIEELFNSYYKGKYDIESAEDLYNAFAKNSYFFLDGKKKNYKKKVEEMVEKVSTSEKIREEMKALYNLSLDISHASGYSWNATEAPIDINSHNALKYCWTLLLDYLYRLKINLSERRIEIDLSETERYIISQIEAEKIQMKVLLHYYQNQLNSTLLNTVVKTD